VSKVSFFSLGEAAKEIPPADYIYRCEDLSYCKPLLYKLCVVPIADRLPTRIAPNDITFLSQVFAFLPAAFGLWLAEAAIAPWWVAVIPFLGWVGYVILDHLDGAHARRTSQSSPLGELVDHWCDAWNGALVPFAWSMCWGGVHWPMVTTVLAALGALAYTFAVSEHKATAVMKLDRMGGTEGMLLMAGSVVPLAIFGHQAVFDTPLPLLKGYTVQHLLQFLCGLGCVGTVKNVILRSGTRSIADVLPLFLSSALVLLWVHLGLDVRFACFMLAAITAIVSGRMVLARTTGLAYRWDGLGLGALLVGIAVESSTNAEQTKLGTASFILTLLVVRACADFAWGARCSRRWIRSGELLGLFFEPRAAAQAAPEPTSQATKKA
jgi:phosphatidylglycerophosphate synthase